MRVLCTPKHLYFLSISLVQNLTAAIRQSTLLRKWFLFWILIRPQTSAGPLSLNVFVLATKEDWLGNMNFWSMMFFKTSWKLTKLSLLYFNKNPHSKSPSLMNVSVSKFAEKFNVNLWLLTLFCNKDFCQSSLSLLLKLIKEELNIICAHSRFTIPTS